MSSILTVSQINRYISHRLAADVKLKGLAIKGEISNFSLNYRSGHAYFSVKDDTAALRCVMFRTAAERLRFQPENGMAVIAFGNLEVYERDGVYQLVTTELQPLGAGAVALGIEQVKKRLADKGVFDPAAKKQVPLVPKKIAAVTSANGAALQDIINILQRRYPVTELEVFPATVQGETAAVSVASALGRADDSGADTIILARGGGSQEDLMAFNTEQVALAVFDCKTPVISAVGHETDTTLADLAADLRAPTPSAAAELAVPDREQIVSAVELVEKRLLSAMISAEEKRSSKLRELSLRLGKLSPEQRLLRALDRTAALENRLRSYAEQKLIKEEMNLDRCAAQLFALSPFNILDRGYSITSRDGRAVTDSSELAAGDRVVLCFARGSAEAEVKKVNENDL